MGKESHEQMSKPGREQMVATYDVIVELMKGSQGVPAFNANVGLQASGSATPSLEDIVTSTMQFVNYA